MNQILDTTKENQSHIPQIFILRHEDDILNSNLGGLYNSYGDVVIEQEFAFHSGVGRIVILFSNSKVELL